MPIPFSCPHCSIVLQIPDEAMGKKTRCPKCKQPFVLPEPFTPLMVAEPIPAPVRPLREQFEEAMPPINRSSIAIVSFAVIGLLVVVAIGSFVAWSVTRKTDTAQVVPKANQHEQVERQEWADASKSGIRLDDMVVAIKSVAIDFVELDDFGRRKSADRYLKVFLSIKNQKPNNIATYTGWGYAPLGRTDVRLYDNFGNNYPLVHFGIGVHIEGQAISERLSPNKAVDDFLAFDIPLENIEYLRLELPASRIQRTGTLRFQIPASMIKR